MFGTTQEDPILARRSNPALDRAPHRRRGCRPDKGGHWPVLPKGFRSSGLSLTSTSMACIQPDFYSPIPAIA